MALFLPKKLFDHECEISVTNKQAYMLILLDLRTLLTNC